MAPFTCCAAQLVISENYYHEIFKGLMLSLSSTFPDIYHNINRNAQTTTKQSKNRYQHTWTKDYMTDEICGLLSRFERPFKDYCYHSPATKDSLKPNFVSEI